MSDPLRVQGDVVARFLQHGPDASSRISSGAADTGQFADSVQALPPVMQSMASQLMVLLNHLSETSGSLGKGADQNFDALKAAARELLGADAVADATSKKLRSDIPVAGAAPTHHVQSAPKGSPAPPTIDPNNL